MKSESPSLLIRSLGSLRLLVVLLGATAAAAAGGSGPAAWPVSVVAFQLPQQASQRQRAREAQIPFSVQSSYESSALRRRRAGQAATSSWTGSCSPSTMPSSTTTLQAMPSLFDHAAASSIGSTHLLLSTIDSDIAKLSDNEFAPVFLGGIAVMVGGLLSAVFVGLVVDKKDLYASLVADSYLQGSGEDDESFWKGLSDEEKKKTQEMLEKVRSGKINSSSNSNGETPLVAAQSLASPANAAKAAQPTESSKADEPKVEVGMFSDYGDDA
jgi:hypothetical protein